MPIKHDGPRKPARVSGKWPALALAIAVHVVFIAVLVFSVRWQNKKPEPVMAELYAPPPKTAAVEAPVPPPVAQPNPIPVPEPKPEPRPAPAVEPRPVPTVIAKPVPAIEKPDPRTAEIALKAKQEEERRKREQADRERKDADKKEADKREAELKRQDELKRQAEQKRVAETRERQTRESEALKAQADRETQIRARQQAERDAQIRAQQQTERDAQIRAEQQASAHARALEDYIQRIRSKVRGNVIEPGEIAGNPEAEFDVVQLPTGEIIDVKLRKSSGVRAYDDAVQRAILKSSPLPRPAVADLWQRVLTLRFKPRE